MFLFAVGYARRAAVSFRGRRQGWACRRRFFALVQLRTLPGDPRSASPSSPGYDLGYAAGSFLRDRKRSPLRWGLATDSINRLGLPGRPGESPPPTGCRSPYAVTYMFGTMGSALVDRTARPPSCSASIFLPACKEYEEKQGRR